MSHTCNTSWYSLEEDDRMTRSVTFVTFRCMLVLQHFSTCWAICCRPCCVLHKSATLCRIKWIAGAPRKNNYLPSNQEDGEFIQFGLSQCKTDSCSVC